MKFKVGDRVRITWKFSQFFNEVLPIQRIDFNDSSLPYAIKVSDNMEHWFSENELEEAPKEEESPTRDPNLAMRFNSGKPELRYVFCFLPALEELAKTCMVGAKKYALYNFMKPCPVSESFDCLNRHLGAVWFRGELVDAEGNSHLGAIGFNALRMVTTILVHPEMDDRPCKVLEKDKNV